MGPLRTDIATALEAERNRLLATKKTLKEHSPKRVEVRRKIELLEEYHALLVSEDDCYMEIKRPYDPTKPLRL